ncbi:agglutinin-2-like, partial [Camellia sinensis]|uniref:agglutinin-2-like n=1 Tax=Camellia sinensis TaxID=4442 RepID=UPI0010366737
MITFLFFLVLLFFYANATPLSFNLPTIEHNDSLINCTGDASISSQGIQVTRDTDLYNASSLQRRTGRATCTQLMHLWDAATGNLTDFSTNFSFIIKGNNYGEGLAFFLAPNGSNIPPNSTGGGLGLINENQTTASTGVNRFVAVEFDTYKNNPWQEGLPINHVGINVNSRSSAVVSSDWQSGITNGKTNEARIKYDS